MTDYAPNCPYDDYARAHGKPPGSVVVWNSRDGWHWRMLDGTTEPAEDPRARVVRTSGEGSPSP
jgi:hypothetical protein